MNNTKPIALKIEDEEDQEDDEWDVGDEDDEDESDWDDDGEDEEQPAPTLDHTVQTDSLTLLFLVTYSVLQDELELSNEH